MLAGHIDWLLLEGHQGAALGTPPVAPHMLTGPMLTEHITDLVANVKRGLEGCADVLTLLFHLQDGQQSRLPWAEVVLRDVRGMHSLVASGGRPSAQLLAHDVDDGLLWA